VDSGAPDTALSLGKSLRIIKSELGELHNDVKPDTSEDPPTPVPSERVDAPTPGHIHTNAGSM
jgi:hypothetical protein